MCGQSIAVHTDANANSPMRSGIDVRREQAGIVSARDVNDVFLSLHR